MPTPTAILLLDTQRFLIRAEQGPIRGSRTRSGPTAFRRCCRPNSFRASKITISPMRHFARWTIREQTFQLLVDVRSFQINTDPELTAEIGFSARILNKEGQVVASHLVSATQEARQA